MDLNFIKNFLIYIISFTLAMFALQSVNYEKFIKKGRVIEAQLLYILIAMALGYLIAQFIQGIIA